MSNLRTCFFQPSHQIRPEKMLMHLVKCKRQHPNRKFVICPLNATHYTDPNQLSEHLKDCPNQGSLMAQFQYSEGVCPYLAHLPEIRPYLDEGQEEWEASVEPKMSYNPADATRNRKVLRSIKVACKSEKKRFYEQERLRLQELDAKRSDGVPIRPGSGLQEVKKEGFLRRSKMESSGLKSASHAELQMADMWTTSTGTSINHGLGRGCVQPSWLMDESLSSPRGMGRGKAHQRTKVGTEMHLRYTQKPQQLWSKGTWEQVKDPTAQLANMSMHP